MSHTPGKMIFEGSDNYGGNGLWIGNAPSGASPTGKLIARLVGDSAEAEANGERLALAWNCFDDLVGIAQGFIEEFGECDQDYEEERSSAAIARNRCVRLYRLATAALANAKPQEVRRDA